MNLKKVVGKLSDRLICQYYDGILFDEGLRLDLLVNERVVIELKAVELMNPVYQAQLISYLRMTGLRLGYLINLNVPVIKEGIKRFVL
jgi:GxxExxY protein